MEKILIFITGIGNLNIVAKIVDLGSAFQRITN